MGKTIRVAKANKKLLLAAFIAGVIALFFVNNFTIQPAYDVVSCTWNQWDCNLTYEGVGWDGQCTEYIEDACCTPIDYCANKVVDNPSECLHYYCTNDGYYCDAVTEEYNQDTGYYSYNCGCVPTSGGYITAI